MTKANKFATKLNDYGWWRTTWSFHLDISFLVRWSRHVAVTEFLSTNVRSFNGSRRGRIKPRKVSIDFSSWIHKHS